MKTKTKKNNLANNKSIDNNWNNYWSNDILKQYFEYAVLIRTFA